MDVIKAITPLMEDISCKVNVEHLPERTFDVKANVLNSAKLQALNGWQPKVRFNQGLRFTRDWLTKNYG
jgi:UDP-glucose 4-epimerase